MGRLRHKFEKGHIGFWKGKKRAPFSLEWRRKISEGHKGLVYKVSEDRGKHRIGVKHTEEARRKMSATRIAKKIGVGASNGSWRGGISAEKGYSKRVKREWIEKNRRKVYDYNRRRVYIIKTNSPMGKGTIQLVYEDNIKKYGTLTCYLCLNPIEFGRDSIDHKISVKKGGSNFYENLAIAHRNCNSKKGTKTLEECKKRRTFWTDQN